MYYLVPRVSRQQLFVPFFFVMATVVTIFNQEYRIVQFDNEILREYDIRGIVNKNLTPASCALCTISSNFSYNGE